MKPFLFLLLIIFIVSCAAPNSSKRTTNYLDKNGKIIKYADFQAKWRDKSNEFFRWDYINSKGKREAKLFSPVYESLMVNYSTLNSKISEITGKTFTDSTVFLIDYYYLNDLCAEGFDNMWSKKEVANRKEFTNKKKQLIADRYPNMELFVLFEEGITLENEAKNTSEYYFIDKDNFFRDNFSKNPSLCGSLILINTDGKSLIRNGEYNSYSMAQHIQPENWKLFF